MSLTLNFTPLVVALSGLLFLSERPGRLQWLGMVLFLVGAAVYFLPFEASLAPLGLAAAVTALLANSASSVLGRAVNRRHDLHPILVTLVSMGLGAVVLLARRSSSTSPSRTRPWLSPCGITRSVALRRA